MTFSGLVALLLRTIYFALAAATLVAVASGAIALADPTPGWQAWRIGLLFGSITFLAFLVIGLIISIFIYGDANGW